MSTFGSMIKKNNSTPRTSAIKNVRGKLGTQNKVIFGRGLPMKKDTMTRKAILGKKMSMPMGTKPSQKNSIGSMTREMKTISKGATAIAHRTGKPRQKVHKYTVGELGKAAHQPTARK